MMKIFFSSLIIIVIFSEYSFGQYIDPGTGSYLFQLSIAALTAIIFYWKQIVGFFKKSKKEDTEDEEKSDQP
jgi:hypothetical protein